nr:hypothetical protein GCM10020092_098620 [Actinoplanes digitatis]
MGAGLPADLTRAEAVLTALGDTLVVSGDRNAIEYAYALRDLDPSRLTLVGLPGDSVINNGRYIGEQLTPVGRGFLKAAAAGTPEAYLADHPKLINK